MRFLWQVGNSSNECFVKCKNDSDDFNIKLNDHTLKLIKQVAVNSFTNVTRSKFLTNVALGHCEGQMERGLVNERLLRQLRINLRGVQVCEEEPSKKYHN